MSCAVPPTVTLSRSRPGSSPPYARKSFIGSTDGAIPDFHSLELGKARFGRRVEIDILLLDESVGCHEVKCQRMHECQHANFTPAVGDLEVFVGVRRQELGVAG